MAIAKTPGHRKIGRLSSRCPCCPPDCQKILTYFMLLNSQNL